MPIGVNRTKRGLAANELVPARAVNRMRTPNVAMIVAAAPDRGKSMGVGGALKLP